jgi:serine/threonine protein kinase
MVQLCRKSREYDEMSKEGKALAPGTVLASRYRVLAEGTSQDLGTEYRTYDILQGQEVATLVLAPRWGSGEEALRCLEEAQRTVADLAVPGLLPYEQVGLVDGHLYVVRTRAEEQTLASLRLQGRRMEIGHAVGLAIGLCEALAPAHRAGFVHGSLAPESVLLGLLPSKDGLAGWSVTLADAGLLPALHAAEAAQGRPWGRIPYLSPEQAAGEHVHPATDVYVIGCLLYEMLTGRPPFRSSDETVLALQHLRYDPPSLQVLVPHAPPALAQIVHKAMAKEPAGRYRHAGQLAHILRTQVGTWAPQQPFTTQPLPLAPSPTLVQEHLIVPPPPPPMQAAEWSSGEIYELEEFDTWDDEPTGVDWLMVALLGLIPLWRTVYRRYTGLLPDSTARLCLVCEREPAKVLFASLDRQTEAAVNLDRWALVGYNSKFTQVPGLVISRQGLGATFSSNRAFSQFGSPAYGFQSRCVVNCDCGYCPLQGVGQLARSNVGGVVQQLHPNRRSQCVVEA